MPHHPARRTEPRPVLAPLLVAAALALGPAPALPHEFWLDVVDYQPKAGASVPIVHRNGQNFLGDSYPYLRASARRFTVIDGRGERPVKAIEGDDPAAEIRFTRKGLAIVVYQGAPETVDFPTMEKFEENLAEEGLEAIAPRHRAEGKPLTAIREEFQRCTKALVQVGGGSGSDRPVGLPIEIVAEKSPYELAAGDALPVRVLLRGAPLAGVLVKAFHHKDAASPRKTRTNAEGRTSIDLPLPGEYLLSAVHMEPPAARSKAHWSSLWASLTFKRP